jgi:hypothetical protein
MQYSPKLLKNTLLLNAQLTTDWIKNQASTDVQRLKSHRTSHLTAVALQ